MVLRHYLMTACLGLPFLALAATGTPQWDPERADLLFSSNASGVAQIYLRPGGGADWQQLTDVEAGANYPVWSPDGEQIAFQVRNDGKFDVYVMNAGGGDLRRLTDHPDHDYLPSWLPGGQQLNFTSWRMEGAESERINHLYIMELDGSNQRRFMEAPTGTSAGIHWAPDGELAVLTRKTSETGADLFLADRRGRLGRRLTDDGRYNGGARVSPDGRWIAFYSHQGLASRIEIIRRDGSERRVLLDSGLNWEPRWSPDGCWLVYSVSVSPDHADVDTWAVPVDGRAAPLRLLTGPGREAEASWRPDPAVRPSCPAEG